MKQMQRSVIHGTEFQGIFFFNLVDNLEKVLNVQCMCVWHNLMTHLVVIQGVNLTINITKYENILSPFLSPQQTLTPF